MPLALDPQQTFDVWVKSDADKPEAERPTFTFRYLNGREWRRVAEIWDGMDERASGPDGIDGIFEALRIGLAGWRNIRRPDGSAWAFDAKDLDLILNPMEAMELVGAMLEGNGLDGDRRGKSDSRS